MQLSANLSSLFKRLEGTILRLQSDELIQQMRNDSSLYACKIKYIQEIIEEEMNSCSQLEESFHLAETLQEKLREREMCIEKMKNEYAIELENIEHHCRELILENEKKLRDKDDTLQKIKYEVSSLQATLSRADINAKTNKEELAKLKHQNTNLRQDRSELENVRFELESQIEFLRKENAERQRTSQGALKESYEQRVNQMTGQYQETIQQMQRDMGLIKESWERACMQLESRHQEELAMRAIEAEERFKKEFAEYADNLKMGSSVVFSDSQEVLGKKVELIEMRYKAEISKLAEEIKQLQEQMTQVKEEIEEKEDIIAELTQNIKDKDAQIEGTTKAMQTQITNKQRDISRLTNELIKQEKQLNAVHAEIEEETVLKKQLKEELSALNKKYSQLSAQFTHQEQHLEESKKIITSHTSKIEDYKNQLIISKEYIAQKQQQITANEIELRKHIFNTQKLQDTINALKQQIEVLSRDAKKGRQQRKRVQQKLDKLHIVVRKISKQAHMLREQVICTVQMLGNKLASQFSLLSDYLAQRNESMLRKHKGQMSELLDEMQEKEKELAESLATEKVQMKLDIKEYEQALKERDGEIYRLKQYIVNLEQQRKELLIDLDSQKLHSIRLEEKIQSNEQAFVNQISKAEKEIARCMSSFNSHWSEQIEKVLQDMDAKDAKIRQLIQKIEQMNAESEQTRRQRVWMEEEIRKYKKKYENFKQQRDEKVQTLLKKLQQQAKHRINLQKQLKEVRMSVMKGTYQQSNNFSFNERESNSKPFTTSTKEDQHRQRERELSEIREMIAKTYKVVDGPPERDIGRNFSKKTLF